MKGGALGEIEEMGVPNKGHYGEKKCS